MKEALILETSVQAINQGVGFNLLRNMGNQGGGKNEKVILQIGQIKLEAQIKAWVPQMNTGALIHQVLERTDPQQCILVADYITPGIGDALRQAGVQYIDSVGNAFIRQPSTFVCIKGNKPENTSPSRKAGKAFQKAGLKITLALLLDGSLLDSPYRTIAKKAATALATVGEVLRDLERTGYLKMDSGVQKRVLINRQQLQQQWAEAYPYGLREKGHIGTFTTDNPLWWQTLGDFSGQWGGEVAAAEYTHYLSPKNAIVYINRADMGSLMKTARLRKIKPHEQPEVLIDMFEPFWLPEAGNLAPPLVVYADLLETGDPRNLETANKLYEQYLS